MQEAQHANLDPRETSLSKAIEEESLRRRRNHSSGGGTGVQFSSIFSIVDNSLEEGAESLRRIPKRGGQKDGDSEKSSAMTVAAATDVKAPAAEPVKEAPKARPEQEQKPKNAKEATAKRPETAEFLQAQVAAIQSRIDAQAHLAARTVDRSAVRTERREGPEVVKARATQKTERAEVRERPSDDRMIAKLGPSEETAALKESVKAPERKERPKQKDADGNGRDGRDERRALDAPKAVRSEDDALRAPKARDRADDKSAQAPKAEAPDARGADRKSVETEQTGLKVADEKPAPEAGSKKKSLQDLEKLTGLHARAAVEFAPVFQPVQIPDLAVKPAVEVLTRGLTVDTVKASARGSAGSNSGAMSQHGGGMAQAKSQTQDKLGETARRLTSYVSGKLERAVNPETTFSDMVAKAKVFMENGRSEMTIQLKPEQLGSLNIKISVEDSQLQAQFVTDRHDVKALLEENVDALKQKLNEVGIEVTAVSVEVRSDAGQTPMDDRQSGGLRRVTVLGGGEDGEPSMEVARADIAYALAGMGTHLSLVA